MSEVSSYDWPLLVRRYGVKVGELEILTSWMQLPAHEKVYNSVVELIER